MLANFNYILMLLVDVSSLALFICSVTFAYKDFNPPYLKIFPYYCLGDIIGETINLVLLSDTTGKKLAIFFNVYTAFELFFLSLFLIQVIHSKRAKRLIWILNASFFALYLWVAIRFGPDHANGSLMSFQCIILMIGSLAYFRDILTTKNQFDLAKEPAFWIATSILFYFSILTPIGAFGFYFVSQKIYGIAESITTIQYFCQIIGNVLMIKGVTCRVSRWSNQPA